MTRRIHDNYSTPPTIARWAVRHAANMAVLPEQGGSIIEPCCGDESPFATAGNELGLLPTGFDVRDVNPEVFRQHGSLITDCSIDTYLEEQGEYSEKYDIVATNPPFSIGERIVRESLRLLKPHGCAVFLVKMAFLGTQKRSELFVERPPAEVWIMRARPSFTGDGKSDLAQEYCFVFWYGPAADGMMKALNQRQTRLYWLDNSKMMDKKRVRIQKDKPDEQE